MTTPPFDSQVTFLYTPDLERARRFYEDTLGLPLILDQGSCCIYAAAPTAYLGVCQRDGLSDQPGRDSKVIVTLVTDNVDGWYDRLQREGVAFEKPPTLNATYHIYHCFLRDPNGYLIEIQRFLDPKWPRR
ncbi:MAG: VOC family protein [Anaerolineae bacterium]|nr:VOC family protein [Anaerolineae bacterium]